MHNSNKDNHLSAPNSAQQPEEGQHIVREVPRYQVIDGHTGRVMGEYGTLFRAGLKADALEIMYAIPVRFVVCEALGSQIGTVYRQDHDASARTK